MKLCLLICLLLVASACERVSVPQGAKARTPPGETGAQQRPAPASGVYGPPARLAALEESAIKESSGIVASRTTPGLYWTHNDSGDGPFIYAFDSRGRRRGTWRVTGATARDWEDIAAGPGPESGRSYLYIGDIGDNRRSRSEIIVYRIPEPTITATDVESTKAKPVSTETAEVIRLRYADDRHDAEALLVHPESGNLYVVTKEPFANPYVYGAVAPYDIVGRTTLARIGELSIPGLFGGMITGGDISPDGRRVAICDYAQGYEIVLADSRAAFNLVWKQPLIPIALGSREQGEAIGYRLDGGALLATSEGKRSPLIEVVRR